MGSQLDSFPLMQQFACPGSLALPFGLARADSVFPLSVADSTHPEVPLPLQSFACLGSAAPVPRSADFEFSVLLRSFAQLDLMVSASGAGCSDVFVPALTNTNLGFASFPRSPGRLGPLMLAMKLVDSGSLILLQSFAQLGPPASLMGLSCAGFVFPLPVAERVCPGSASLPRSLARPGASVPAFCDKSPGSSSLLRNSGYTGLAATVSGLACLDVLVFVLGGSRPGPSLSLHSLSRTGSAMLVPGMSHIGSSMSLRQPARPEASASICGLACLEVPVLVLAEAHSGPSTPSQSLA